MKMLGLSFKMYASESTDEMYPPLAPYDDLWIFDVKTMYPEYLDDLSLLVSKDDPDRDSLLAEFDAMQESGEMDWERVNRIAARRFVYFPWAVDDPADLPELAAARHRISTADYDADLENGPDGKTFFRMREGVERFLLTDLFSPDPSSETLSQIPIIMETKITGMSDDSHVLYSDGHVDLYRGQNYSIPLDDLMAVLYPNGMSEVDLRKTFDLMYPHGVPRIDSDD
jgi:hypothetical protein